MTTCQHFLHISPFFTVTKKRHKTSQISYNILVIFMVTKSYDRNSAINYAKKWALSRNPKYYNFDAVGGDCTSFVSQCLYAGSKKMNYNTKNGWFYTNGYNKSPSWSGVEFLYKFLTTNKGYGPRGKTISQSEVKPGDIAQLSFDGNTFGHSLFIIDVGNPNNLNQISVATHTYDTLGKKIGEYNFSKIRFVHIEDIGF